MADGNNAPPLIPGSTLLDSTSSPVSLISFGTPYTIFTLGILLRLHRKEIQEMSSVGTVFLLGTILYLLTTDF
jgi:hypothetical protein